MVKLEPAAKGQEQGPSRNSNASTTSTTTTTAVKRSATPIIAPTPAKKSKSPPSSTIPITPISHVENGIVLFLLLFIS